MSPMSAGTALLVVGLVVALIGVGLALRRRLAGRPAMVGVPDTGPIDDVNDVFERVAETYHSVDRGLRTGVIVAVVGLLVAGIGAYLGSDARALGTDVGGSGTSNHARIGGTW
jgi:hypothetical protein